MILVAGATGSLGGMIVRLLRSQDTPVRALVRAHANTTELAAAGATLVIADLKERATLDAACAGVTTVITTANAVKRGPPDTIESVDEQGNRNLIDAAVAAGVQQFIFVSALGSARDSPVPLFRAKAATEAYVRASGLSYTIFAPDAFMDEWVTMIVGAPIRAGLPVTVVEPAEHRHSFIAAADVAAYTVAAVGHPAAQNRVIPLGGPAPLSWREVIAAFARVLNRQVDMQLVPPGTPIRDVPDVITMLMAALETYDSPVDMAELAQVFGIVPTSIDDFARSILFNT